MLECV
jgi:hypothetical protein